MSDVMGEMTERFATGSNDWLLGENLPRNNQIFQGYYRYIRNMRDTEDPYATDRGPSSIKARDYRQCGEQHVMSNVSSHVFYDVVQAIGADAAERIWYRTMVYHLHPKSGEGDMRFGTIASAQELYPNNPALSQAVAVAWNTAGVGANYDDGGKCAGAIIFGDAAGAALSGTGLSGLSSDGPDANSVNAVLYRIRNELMPDSSAGGHFEGVYENQTGRMTDLLLQDPNLREQAAHVLQEMTPGFNGLVDGDGSQFQMSGQSIDDLKGLLGNLAQADQDAGGGQLAAVINTEENEVNLDQFKGENYQQVLDTLNQEFPSSSPQSEQDSQPPYAGGDPTVNTGGGDPTVTGDPSPDPSAPGAGDTGAPSSSDPSTAGAGDTGAPSSSDPSAGDTGAPSPSDPSASGAGN